MECERNIVILKGEIYMKKLSRYFIIIVIILAITIGIPIIINKALYLPIKTNTTNDSDWLAFWGSFLVEYLEDLQH